MKRRETDPASNQFPECSPPSGTHRNSQSWVEKRRGRKETDLVEEKESPKEERDRGDQEKERGNQKMREQASQ